MTNSSKVFDGLLVLRYRSGAKKALGILVNKYHKRLCKHSYHYTQDIEASKDIVQDSWGVIAKKIHQIKDPNLFGSWAFRIVTRKSLDYKQKQKRELGKLQSYYHSSKESDVVEDNDAQLKKMLIAIKSLPIDQQAVIRLFYTENYSLREISNILQVSIGTVKSRLFHAREKLKLILK